MNYVKNSIGWADYTINPVKGLCKNDCSYCYAKKIYKRFGWDKEISFHPEVFNDLDKLKKPSRIFIGSTHEIFGNWIPKEWIQAILEIVKKYPQHTFLFLSKNPERYLMFKFPNNCWLGATVTGTEILLYTYDLEFIFASKDNLCFISIEPLLNKPFAYPISADWFIVGGLTPKPVHKKEWVDEIIKDAREANIPIFLKDNLKYNKKIKEFPEFKESKDLPKFKDIIGLLK